MHLAIILFAASGQTQTSTQSHDFHRPPQAGPITVDWIRFESGEWHNGECRRMDVDEIEFDADQSGLDVWDWDDVTDLYLPGVSEYVFVKDETLKGTGRLDRDTVIVQTAAGEQRRPRSELLRIVVGVKRELSRWSFDLGLQLDANAGNTRNANMTATMDLGRRGRTTRFRLGYRGAMGSAVTADTGGEFAVNIFNHKGLSSFDWYFTKRFFWRTYDVYVRHDRFQDVAVEVRPSTGIGYALIEAKKVTVDTSVGGAFQNTTFISDSGAINTAGILATAVIEWDITPDVELRFDERVFGDLRIESGTDYRNQTELRSQLDFEFEITSVLDFILTAIHRFRLEPAGISPITGQTPKQNDLTMGVGIQVSLGQ